MQPPASDVLLSELANQTLINPLALGFTIALGIALLVLPRRFAAAPIVIIACLLPLGQRIVIAGLDFTMLRILILVGWTRIFIRGGVGSFRPNWMDKIFFAWVISGTIVYTIQRASLAALVFKLGAAFDTLGVYFLFRLLIRNPADMRAMLHALAVLSVPFALAMSIEWMTGRNYFSVFGGVPEFTFVREGRLRCQGTFRHPIMAGSFGAGIAPIFIALFFDRRTNRALAVAAAACSVAIVGLASSSGAVLGLLAGIGGWGLWFLRGRIRILNLSIVGAICVAQLFMKHPFWHLFVRMNLFSGSTGWHRYALIDAAISHFPEWALIGTASTAHWGHQMEDVTSQYILEGVRGGFATFVLFVAILVAAFRSLGNAVRRLNRVSIGSVSERRNLQYLFWGLGAALFSHCISFIAVSYFGQIQVFFAMNLALASFAGDYTRQLVRRAAKAASAQPADQPTLPARSSATP